MAQGLPSLGTVTTASAGAHTHSRGTMNITGNVGISAPRNEFNDNGVSGAFYTAAGRDGWIMNGSNSYREGYLAFAASRNWTGATSSNGAHTHALTLSSTGLYGKSSNVTPLSQSVLWYIKY